jgi:hypothetical protein
VTVARDLFLARMCCVTALGAIFPGGTEYIHHDFEDPLLDAGPEGAPCTSFRRVSDEIREWIDVTFGST